MQRTLCAFALLAVLALANAQQQICLPDQFQWQRSAEFHDTNTQFGFDQSQEFFNHDTQEYRYREDVTDDKGDQTFVDLIIKANLKKSWTLQGKKGSGSFTCTLQAYSGNLPTPCLLSNATIRGSYYMAGDVFTNEWHENGYNGNVGFFDSIGMAAFTNIPIFRRSYWKSTQFEGQANEFYFNFGLNLPNGAFDVPAICQQATVSNKPLTLEAVQKMGGLRFALKEH